MWAQHFQTGATPQGNLNFDNEYKKMVDLDIEITKLLCKDENSFMEQVTESEVIAALERLNNNKTVDIMGLTSEHFKLAGQELAHLLSELHD